MFLNERETTISGVLATLAMAFGFASNVEAKTTVEIIGDCTYTTTYQDGAKAATKPAVKKVAPRRVVPTPKPIISADTAIPAQAAPKPKRKHVAKPSAVVASSTSQIPSIPRSVTTVQCPNSQSTIPQIPEIPHLGIPNFTPAPQMEPNTEPNNFVSPKVIPSPFFGSPRGGFPFFLVPPPIGNGGGFIGGGNPPIGNTGSSGTCEIFWNAVKGSDGKTDPVALEKAKNETPKLYEQCHDKPDTHPEPNPNPNPNPNPPPVIHPVPEPSTLSLVSLALIFAAARFSLGRRVSRMISSFSREPQ